MYVVVLCKIIVVIQILHAGEQDKNPGRILKFTVINRGGTTVLAYN